MKDELKGRVSRRLLLRRLGVGAALAWLEPVVTTVGGGPDRLCEACSEPCDWTCGRTRCVCGTGCGPIGIAYCSPDVDGNCFCWEDSLCSEVSDCTSNSDCPPGYACIPNSCCGLVTAFSAGGVGRIGRSTKPTRPKCLPACGARSSSS